MEIDSKRHTDSRESRYLDCCLVGLDSISRDGSESALGFRIGLIPTQLRGQKSKGVAEGDSMRLP